MAKVLSFRFQQCFGPFTIYLCKGPLKGDFLDIYVTAFFGVRKFKNTFAMGAIFVLKIFKVEFKFIKCQKKLEKNFPF